MQIRRIVFDEKKHIPIWEMFPYFCCHKNYSNLPSLAIFTNRHMSVHQIMMMPRTKSSICNVISMRMISLFLKITTLGSERFYFPFPFLSERVALRSIPGFSSRLLLRLCLGGGVRIRVTHGTAGSTPMSNFFLAF